MPFIVSPNCKSNLSFGLFSAKAAFYFFVTLSSLWRVAQAPKDLLICPIYTLYRNATNQKAQICTNSTYLPFCLRQSVLAFDSFHIKGGLNRKAAGYDPSLQFPKKSFRHLQPRSNPPNSWLYNPLNISPHTPAMFGVQTPPY